MSKNGIDIMEYTRKRSQFGKNILRLSSAKLDAPHHLSVSVSLFYRSKRVNGVSVGCLSFCSFTHHSRRHEIVPLIRVCRLIDWKCVLWHCYHADNSWPSIWFASSRYTVFVCGRSVWFARCAVEMLELKVVLTKWSSDNWIGRLFGGSHCLPRATIPSSESSIHCTMPNSSLNFPMHTSFHSLARAHFVVSLQRSKKTNNKTIFVGLNRHCKILRTFITIR